MSSTTYEIFERNGQHFVRGQRHDIPADTWAALREAVRAMKEYSRKGDMTRASD